MSAPIGPSSFSDEAAEVIARWSSMKTARMNWDVLWDQCARYISPRKGDILTKNTPGQNQTLFIYDTTAEEALGIGAAGMITHICPAGEKWLRLEPKSKNATPEFKAWLDGCSDALTDIFYESNFYEGMHEDFLDALNFATSSILADEDPEMVVNFVNIPVGTFAIEENARGVVDTFAREWKWTARQAEQKWGRNNLGDMVKKVLDLNSPTDASRRFTFIHFVEPRANSTYRGGPAAGSMRPIRSCYVSVEDKKVIEEGGYYSMPYFVSRLLRSNNEVYGRGPGIQTLPKIKLLNAMVRDYLTGVEKMVNPPWLVGDDTTWQMDGRPNAQNYWDTSNPAGKPEQVSLKNNVQWAKEMIDEERQGVRRAFFNEMFQMLSNLEESKRDKTAYEVQQMVAEKLLLFSPLFGRITREKLTPIISRVFDIAARASASAWASGQDGLLPLPPENVQGQDYKVVYISKIALAIKAAENQSFATMMTLIEQAAAIDSSVVNLMKVRDGLRRVSHNIGLPSTLMRTDREVDQLTQAQQAAAQQAQQAQTAELATRSVKNLGPEAQTQAARKIIGNSQQAA